jgi:hypothetical protein
VDGGGANRGGRRVDACDRNRPRQRFRRREHFVDLEPGGNDRRQGRVEPRLVRRQPLAPLPEDDVRSDGQPVGVLRPAEALDEALAIGIAAPRLDETGGRGQRSTAGVGANERDAVWAELDPCRRPTLPSPRTPT